MQADGSGLSRKNLISPKSLVLALRGFLQKAPAFVNILPVAGKFTDVVSATLVQKELILIFNT
jgi:D-alanyl-D-alanine carboxypeptidase